MSDYSNFDVIVVGAGFYGATIAERAAASGLSVCIIDKRNHLGGNAYSSINKPTGIEVHQYGAHLFHTSNIEVWNYLNQFTKFTTYQHRVFAKYRGAIYSLPINLGTICQFFGRALSPDEARSLIAEQSSALAGRDPKNLEEKAISLIGRPLYEAFVKGYTLKQWQTEPHQLSASIIARLPVRYNFDNRYFNDTFEGLPMDGYTKIFERMLSSDKIVIKLGVDFFEVKANFQPRQRIFYTGSIDRFFNYQYGILGWRTIDFKWSIEDVTDYQGTSVVNYSDPEIPWTRIIEFRHFHPERNYRDGKTIIAKEFSRFAGENDEPYYPIDTVVDKEKFLKYRALADSITNVTFGGRLGTYKYLDMHQAIAMALRDAKRYFNH
ncbi:UDP-galactopyranose mutase [Rhizobiales bacterium TNE-4]|nr:UDP-galactopyranose mutase [Rhizobiales bacterium TNE-4]MBV1828612.1 UDP-galactopyranose mutase [Rhizobiales bacterium TNE-4]